MFQPSYFKQINALCGKNSDLLNTEAGDVKQQQQLWFKVLKCIAVLCNVPGYAQFLVIK